MPVVSDKGVVNVILYLPTMHVVSDKGVVNVSLYIPTMPVVSDKGVVNVSLYIPAMPAVSDRALPMPRSDPPSPLQPSQDRQRMHMHRQRMGLPHEGPEQHMVRGGGGGGAVCKGTQSDVRYMSRVQRHAE